MKARWFVLPVVIVLFMTGACSIKELDLIQDKEFSQELVFTAQSGELDTKTAFQSDETSIWWSPADEISIFYGASSGNKFTANNTEEVARAEFHGTLNAFTGESEAGEAYYFWAVYPYSSANSCDGASVTVNLSDQQVAKAGTFAPNTNISIARSTGLNLAFFNACSWFRFSVKKEGIKRVIFRGNNNEDVAGQFSVSMGGDGRPTAPTVVDGRKEIVLTMPNDDVFAVGEMYYITLLPQVFQNGFTVTFETEEEEGSRSISAKATYLRSKYNTGVEFDKNVTYGKKRWVDLGLSVLWANNNLGASSETGSGLYYAWAETAQKDTYNDNTYKWWEYKSYDSSYLIHKYVIKDSYSYKGPYDYRYIIEAEDDAASVALGGDWRIPTRAEAKELIDNCEWTWQENYYGVTGYLVRSKVEGYTNKSIFLPLTGFKFDSAVEATQYYGIYWLSNLFEHDTQSAWGMIIMNPDYYSSHYSYSSLNAIDTDAYVRNQGATIRPVLGKRKEVSSITLDKTTLEIGKGQKTTINASLNPVDAPGFGIIWKSSDESVVTVTDVSSIDPVNHYLRAEIVAVGFGEATITAESVDTGVQTVCHVIVGEPQPVDLGLSVKWGTINIGAANNKGTGKTDYYWREYDVAQYELGDKWRLPTYSEASDLINPSNCQWNWISENSKETGYEIISQLNGESIFLPRLSSKYNSESYYLTSTKDGSKVYHIYFTDSEYKVALYYNSGAIIRPVYDDNIIPITGLSLDKTSIDLELGASTTLLATVIPSNATYSNIPTQWTSSNTSIATVDANGTVTAVSFGTVVITAQTSGEIKTSCTINVTYPIPEVVDLGLSVKWASANLGAVNAYDFGSAFAWGETSPKTSYSWSNYKWCNGASNSITKYYCYSYDTDNWGGDGAPDMKSVLEAEDDAATVNLGGGWRMPTKAEFLELINNCTWTEYTYNKVKGFKITSNQNGFTEAWIFVPYTSGTYYWASTLSNSWSQYRADGLYISASSQSIWGNDTDRAYGKYIRPVYSD